MDNAADVGAAGLLFVMNLPRSQILGNYEPYGGLDWASRALLGSDEGQALYDALAGGGRPLAHLVLRAGFAKVVTPSIFATIPGGSSQRIVIDSHTDGTNAVEDNGPVVTIAMARYFASLPAVGEISAPMFRYDPAFGLDAINFNVTHAEMLAFTSRVLSFGRMSQSAIAGFVPRERQSADRGRTPLFARHDLAAMSMATRTMKGLSGGNRQRLVLAAIGGPRAPWPHA